MSVCMNVCMYVGMYVSQPQLHMQSPLSRMGSACLGLTHYMEEYRTTRCSLIHNAVPLYV